MRDLTLETIKVAFVACNQNILENKSTPEESIREYLMVIALCMIRDLEIKESKLYSERLKEDRHG